MGIRVKAVKETRRGAWHGPMPVCCEPKHVINSPLLPRSRKKKNISEYLMLFDALLLIRVKIRTIFSVSSEGDAVSQSWCICLWGYSEIIKKSSSDPIMRE